MLFYKTIIIVSFLCGASTIVEAAPGLSARALYLQANVTSEIKQLNGTLESVFIPIDDFHSELKDVIEASLNHDDPEVKKYMTENQYKYWSLVYRLLTDKYLVELVHAYDGLTNTCKGLILDIDNHGSKMEEILKKRGCSDDQINQYLDRYFEKMHFLFIFELSYLERKKSITNAVGSESFFIHKNIVSFLYDCLDTSDVVCYSNNEELFDYHVEFSEAKNIAYTAYQKHTIEKIQKFLDRRINLSVQQFSDDAWNENCKPDRF